MASSLFFVLKVDHNLISPQYLALYMNTNKFQNKLRLISAGSSIPSIPKKELLQLDIVFPALKEQKRIIKLNTLLEKDINIEKDILFHKKNLRKGLIEQLINYV